MDTNVQPSNRYEAEAFDNDYNSRDYTCPVCGKLFHLPMYMSRSDYVYTITVRDRKTKKNLQRKCCSYSCYRKGSQ